MFFTFKSIIPLLIILLAVALPASARVEPSVTDRFTLPPLQGETTNSGVSRAFFGEHNSMILLAGGAGLSERPPAGGRTARYQSAIYAKTVNGTSWTLAGELPEPMGDGISVRTPRGIVCVGGTRGGTGERTSGEAFLLTWDAAARKPAMRALPPFPYAVKTGAGAAQGNMVYVVAGRRETQNSTSDIWRLDLDAWSLAPKQTQWEALPALPVAREQPLAVIQNASQKQSALFVFGGMRPAREGSPDPLCDAWRYDLDQGISGKWTALGAVTNRAAASPILLSGAVAVASGNQHILCVGGSAFPRRLLAYHTVTDRWFDAGELPEGARCGAAVLLQSDGRLLIASGRAAPGGDGAACSLATFRKTKSFHPVNMAVMGIYLVGMVLVGLYFMRRNKNSDDYFKGGGRLPWWAVSMSLYATMFSSITFLSVPAMSYLSDCRYMVISFGIILLAPVVSHFYLPFFRKLNLTSAYEFLEVRFNLACRLFASAAFTLFMISRTAIVTYLPAIALAAVADIPVNTAIVLVTVVTILYCTMGGIEAVIWSDFIQSVLLIAGTALIAILLIAGTDGGFSGFLSIGQAAGKFRVFDFAFDMKAPVFWVVFIGGLVANLSSYTSDQCVVQRYMTTRDMAGARKSILFNGCFSFANSIFFFLLGVGLYTFYTSHPELLDVTMPKNDSIFPLFIADALPVGINGVVFATLAAATMSTLSSNLNSSATAVTTDFYVRLTGCTDERKKLRCGQVVTIVTGILGGAFALLLANMQIYSIYDQFQRFLGLLTGGLACLFFMGIFLRRVTGAGALCGLIANYAVCIYLDQTSAAWKPHLLMYGAIGMVTCLIVASVVSFFFPIKTSRQ